MSIFSSFLNGLITVSGIWIPATLVCAIPWVQRQLFYLHWARLWWGVRLNIPESLGFLKSQVVPFYIQTKDGNEVYSWLVVPVGVYAKHVEEFRQENLKLWGDVKEKQAFKCLFEDPESRLVIYFHGNIGTIAQERRTWEYRNISSGASNKIFVLAFDYRGFGYSKGVPTEDGCITDAVAVIRWAMDEAKIPSNRIVLHSQSLGTAIATGAAHYFANLEPRVEFAGLLLCAGFTDASAAFQNFGFNVGVTPLNPMKWCPPLQRWFGRRLTDTYRTSEKLADLVRKSNRVRLSLIHSMDDGIMPWQHTEELFKAVLQDLEPSRADLDNRIHTIDLGEGGFVETWSFEDKIIAKEIAKDGGKWHRIQGSPCPADGLYRP
ncbi:alpha/beta-hydrolase [Rhizodiscina lignyota]|uniref:Alpha/beta-hydrolase n=1 Tax=Rhizodiscina lignyota TaxID=1504668 RepID=A0A9P4M8N8_9PEZI|nr:alpha/beta-hydrolase [Rhizodiscina lignyota]